MSAVRRLAALVALMLIAASAAMSAEVAIPPSPTRWATDRAGFLEAQTVAALDARLEAYQSQTGHQLLVYVTPTTGDTPTEDWTVRAFARWKAGRKGLDDGLILFVFPTDHKVRIEVGYGLEQSVPDAVAARIIDTMTPKIRAGQQDEAVMGAIDQIIAAIGGPAASSGKSSVVQAGGGVAEPVRAQTPIPYATDPEQETSWRIGLVLALVGVPLLLVLIFWLASKLPTPKDTYISSHGDGFGSALGVGGFLLGSALSIGGFSGGGGMSGGGGATGSW